ncbi:MAG: 30S ribosomal protein S17 [Candidatus Daviesbacteria bacterium]|nr:30S ribosomal protein S17 [Candidatus Daviesbacteria bacterium]
MASKKIKKEVNKEMNKEEGRKPMEKQQQIFKGRVVSIKAQQTATVLLESRKTHPLYKKSYAQSKKYLVHDELEVKMGDIVEIVKCRPISKNKHFRILKVVGRDIEAIVTEKINEDVKKAIEEVIPVEQEEVVEVVEAVEEIKPKKATKTKESK